MDHTEALRLQAAEKYVLRELSPTQTEEYEEHFFDCAECALDIKAATAFVDASREVFCEQRERELVPQDARSPAGWFSWLKPAFAVPVLAGLLLLIGYGTLVTTQHVNHSAANASTHSPLLVASTQASGESFQLHGIARGERRAAQDDEKADRVSVHSGQSFDLRFDFLPSSTFPRYIGQLQDEEGRDVLDVSLSDDLVKKEVHVPVSAGSVHAGSYNLVIAGDPSAAGKFQPENETARFSFRVEILP